MIIVRITGGLGNQLFQLGLAYFLTDTTNHVVKIDLSFYSDQKHMLYKRYLNSNSIPARKFEFYSSMPFAICNFDDICGILLDNTDKEGLLFLAKRNFLRLIKQLISTSLLLKIFRKRVVNETLISCHNFDTDNLIYSGYWQIDLFFKNYENKLKYHLDNLLQNIYSFNDNVHYNFNEYIVIHVRKGDYLKIDEYFDLDMTYYKNSIDYIKNINPRLKKILVITNDIIWCEQNLELDNFEIEFSNVKNDIYYDFSIMKKSKYIITSNSTFCFWATFLGNPIVATIPNLWYKDRKFGYLPDSWQIINCIK